MLIRQSSRSILLLTRIRDKEHHKKVESAAKKVADSFGNFADI